MQLTIGARVAARGLTWDVLEREPLGGQVRLRLRCVTDDLLGLEWDMLHPQEPVSLLRAEPRPDQPATLAAWRLYHQACLLDEVPGTSALSIANPGRVKIEPYQLVPLMRALDLPRPRLLLADGVGLGKTIEAGLIAAELIARRRAHRILIVAPAGPLLKQWEQEMRHRFGLRFAVLADASAVRDERRKLELGGNPFGAIAFVLTSLDFAKQESVLEDLERAAWDLVIIDEAHHCVSAANTTNRDDTLRRRLAEVLARRTDGLLLLTATPHDGYDPHFASLIELLDPSLVDGRGGLAGYAYRRHVVRRLKSHISDPATGRPLFRDRRVIPVPVTTDDSSVQAFHRALSALVAPRLTKATQSKNFADALAFVSLLKRSVSTIRACVNTLRVVAERYAGLEDCAEPAAIRRERVRTLRAYRRKALRFGVLDSQAESDVERLEAEDVAAELHATGDTAAVLHRLIDLGQAAEAADPKLDALVTEIRLIRAMDKRKNVLIYTEYADSQLAAVRALHAARGIEGEILTISGADQEDARSRAAERCAEEDGIILVSTDSLSEGLNLQQRCHHLIHLDLPYNPNRLEQRNGRIDRYGQTLDPEIRYLCLAGTFEERLLLRLIAKYEKARAQLTFMPDTLGMTAAEDRLGTGLLVGLAEEQATLFPDGKPPIPTIDHAAAEAQTEAYRDLLHEIDRAYEGSDGMAARHGWLSGQGLNADAALMTAAAEARQTAQRHAARIDLPDFVAAAAAWPLAVGRPDHTDGSGRSMLPPTADLTFATPPDWTQALAGLPGCDPVTCQIHLTRDPAQMRDPTGNPVTVLGRAHPVVKKAIGRVRRGGDNRVSVARGEALGLLLTYTMEVHAPRHVALQRLIAVLLPREGAPRVLREPEDWLPLAEPGRAVTLDNPWRLFEAWAPLRQPEADAATLETMDELAATFAAHHTDKHRAERAELDLWLARRADMICGARRTETGDLFGAPPKGPVWRRAPEPLTRLAGFATDPGNAPAERREADSVVSLYLRRDNENASLSEPVLHLTGLLMLVPAA
jgi:ERCC4-related helicase